MTRVEFAKGIQLLSAALGVSIEERTAEAWFAMVKDLPGEAWLKAVGRYLAEDEYRGLPPIGKLRRFAVESTRGLPESPEIAFGRVRRAIRRHGHMSPQGAREELGPTVWQAIEGIGGWSRVCESPVDQRQALYAQFRDAMRAVVIREESMARLPEFARPPERLPGGQAKIAGGASRAIVRRAAEATRIPGQEAGDA